MQYDASLSSPSISKGWSSPTPPSLLSTSCSGDDTLTRMAFLDLNISCRILSQNQVSALSDLMHSFKHLDFRNLFSKPRLTCVNQVCQTPNTTLSAPFYEEDLNERADLMQSWSPPVQTRRTNLVGGCIMTRLLRTRHLINLAIGQTLALYFDNLTWICMLTYNPQVYLSLSLEHHKFFTRASLKWWTLIHTVWPPWLVTKSGGMNINTENSDLMRYVYCALVQSSSLVADIVLKPENRWCLTPLQPLEAFISNHTDSVMMQVVPMTWLTLRYQPFQT